jgi:acetyl-CoA acetyltransferase
MQARAGLEAGTWAEEDLATVVADSRKAAMDNPYALLSGDVSVDKLLAEPLFSDPLRRHDCAPVTDGAAAIVLAADDRARSVCERPAWITGLEHRSDGQNLSLRDLGRAPSAAAAAAPLDLTGVEVAELHAPFSHQELLLRQELGLSSDVDINPSGGPLAGNPMFSGGLIRIGEAARRIQDGTATKTLAHATSGPALQQNLVCLMEVSTGSTTGGN